MNHIGETPDSFLINANRVQNPFEMSVTLVGERTGWFEID